MKIRKRFIVVFAIIVALVFYRTYQQNKGFEVTDDMIYTFEGQFGPSATSVLPPKEITSWKKYAEGADYGIGILLTDTNSSWLGLVHAFKTFGIPFKFHTKAEQAVKHDVVLAYPIISGKALDAKSLQVLGSYLRKGGTIIGTHVLGGIRGDFGIEDATPSAVNFKVRLNDSENSLLKEFKDSKEKEISLGDPKSFKETVGTYRYIKPTNKPLLVYENGEACMTQNYFPGGGKAFALGIDLGEFILRSHNERGYNAQRTYVNDYEPSLDVLIRIIKNIYRESSPDAVTLNTVPGDKKLNVCITHDIDFTKSIKYAVDYAKLEKSQGIEATYFIQTKYVKDWNDDIFFNEEGASYVRKIADMGMEIASHSVAHSHIYSKFPIGSGTESYPDYRPFVKGRDEAVGGSVLGELRVSKFLLEKAVKNCQVVSFRPGHLSYPFSLPQCLMATGYQYSSSVTANNVLTHLPYQMQYNRETKQELTVFEFPVTIEDEEKPKLGQRLDKSLELAKKLSAYGGFMNVLIHTDILSHKYAYQKALVDSLKNVASFLSLKTFASWWKIRNQLSFYVKKKANELELILYSGKPIQDCAFTLPKGLFYSGNDKNISQKGNLLIIHRLEKALTIPLQRKS